MNSKRTAGAGTRLKRSASRTDPRDPLIWYLGRAYYTYVGLLEQVLAETGLDEHLRPGMGHILFTLFEEDDLTIKEIAERSELANSTLTGMLNRMEKGRLLTRRRDATDGRLIRVRLTELGRSLEPRCRSAMARFDDLFRNGLGDSETHRVKKSLRKVIDVLRNASL